MKHLTQQPLHIFSYRQNSNYQSNLSDRVGVERSQANTLNELLLIQMHFHPEKKILESQKPKQHCRFKKQTNYRLPNY